LNPELITENIREDFPNRDVFELKDIIHHSRLN